MGKRIIKSVLRATKILDYIGNNTNEVRLTAISNDLEINMSTIHSIIATLEKAGYISQNKNNHKYSLGKKLFELGKVYEGKMSFTALARPYLKKLADKFDETVQLGVLSNDKVLYIDKIESKHSLRMTCQMGSKDELHSSATGKLLLAYLKDKEVDKLLNKKLEKYTENTITDPKKLKEELDKIKKQGFALDKEEAEVGLNCAAAPVKDSFGNVIAAIGISTPTSRISEAQLMEIKDNLIKEASDLSDLLS
jgi:DNA-binding IclR family transcriptional regulator